MLINEFMLNFYRNVDVYKGVYMGEEPSHFCVMKTPILLSEMTVKGVIKEYLSLFDLFFETDWVDICNEYTLVVGSEPPSILKDLYNLGSLPLADSVRRGKDRNELFRLSNTVSGFGWLTKSVSRCLCTVLEDIVCNTKDYSIKHDYFCNCCCLEDYNIESYIIEHNVYRNISNSIYTKEVMLSDLLCSNMFTERGNLESVLKGKNTLVINVDIDMGRFVNWVTFHKTVILKSDKIINIRFIGSEYNLVPWLFGEMDSDTMYFDTYFEMLNSVKENPKYSELFSYGEQKEVCVVGNMLYNITMFSNTDEYHMFNGEIGEVEVFNRSMNMEEIGVLKAIELIFADVEKEKGTICSNLRFVVNHSTLLDYKFMNRNKIKNYAETNFVIGDLKNNVVSLCF